MHPRPCVDQLREPRQFDRAGGRVGYVIWRGRQSQPVAAPLHHEPGTRRHQHAGNRTCDHSAAESGPTAHGQRAVAAQLQGRKPVPCPEPLPEHDGGRRSTAPRDGTHPKRELEVSGMQLVPETSLVPGANGSQPVAQRGHLPHPIRQRDHHRRRHPAQRGGAHRRPQYRRGHRLLADPRPAPPQFANRLRAALEEFEPHVDRHSRLQLHRARVFSHRMERPVVHQLLAVDPQPDAVVGLSEERVQP